ncbi:MAG: thioredoxin family protein [Acidimicrobiia bacterium]
MEITIVHVPDCPNLSLIKSRLAAALEIIGRAASVDDRVVIDAEEAVDIGFGGSPTILVGGQDAFPGSSVGLGCRLYPTEDGPQGAPSVAQLVAALTTGSPA